MQNAKLKIIAKQSFDISNARFVIKYPDPILKKKSTEVKEITPEIKKLINDMTKTMKVNGGVGLAAPQVGVSKRVIVVETENGPLAAINPKILKKSQHIVSDEEGCLSIPEIRLQIKRAEEVEVGALNQEGKIFRIKAKGILARIFQHEIDHLDGVLLIDRLNIFQKWRIKNKLKQYGAR